MTKQVREEMKKMDKAELRLAIADGIRMAVRDFLHETVADINRKKDGFFKKLGRLIFRFFISGAVIGLLHLIFHGKYQKMADYIVNSWGG